VTGLNNAEIIQDYRLVRMVALALATLAFLVAVTKLSTGELPHERSRAQGLLVTSLLVFLFLAGDRILVRGLAEWFGVDTANLPVYWQ
jgi:hypothetical protein